MPSRWNNILMGSRCKVGCNHLRHWWIFWIHPPVTVAGCPDPSDIVLSRPIISPYLMYLFLDSFVFVSKAALLWYLSVVEVEGRLTLPWHGLWRSRGPRQTAGILKCWSTSPTSAASPNLHLMSWSRKELERVLFYIYFITGIFTKTVKNVQTYTHTWPLPKVFVIHIQ